MKDTVDFKQQEAIIIDYIKTHERCDLVDVIHGIDLPADFIATALILMINDGIISRVHSHGISYTYVVN